MMVFILMMLDTATAMLKILYRQEPCSIAIDDIITEAPKAMAMARTHGSHGRVLLENMP